MIRKALVSPCKRYRYYLARCWDGQQFNNPLVFIMLNPSTADDQLDDPTIRRCIGFAKRLGHGSLLVLNRFALRATDPSELQLAENPHGMENECWLDMLRPLRGPIVAAWGAHPVVSQKARPLPSHLTDRLMCLGTTKDGSPRHPLYVRADQPLIPWGANISRPETDADKIARLEAELAERDARIAELVAKRATLTSDGGE